jgi:hypothetical protein
VEGRPQWHHGGAGGVSGGGECEGAALSSRPDEHTAGQQHSLVYRRCWACHGQGGEGPAGEGGRGGRGGASGEGGEEGGGRERSGEWEGAAAVYSRPDEHRRPAARPCWRTGSPCGGRRPLRAAVAAEHDTTAFGARTGGHWARHGRPGLNAGPFFSDAPACINNQFGGINQNRRFEGKTAGEWTFRLRTIAHGVPAGRQHTPGCTEVRHGTASLLFVTDGRHLLQPGRAGTPTHQHGISLWWHAG